MASCPELPQEVWHLVVRRLDLWSRAQLRATCTYLNQVVLTSVASLSLPADLPVPVLTASVLEGVAVLVRRSLRELVWIASAPLRVPVSPFALQGCRALTRFRFRSCALANVNLASSVMAMLLNQSMWPLLEELDVRGSGMEHWLGVLANARPLLKTFQFGCDLEQNYRENGHLVRALRDMRSSDVEPRYEDVVLSKMLASLPRLSKLSAFRCVTPDVITAEAAARLTSLCLLHDDLRFAFIAPMRAVVELNVRGSYFPLTLFDGATRLRRVDVSCSNCSPLALANLIDCAPQLEWLDLCYCEPLVAQCHLVYGLLMRLAASGRVKMLGLGGFGEAMTDSNFLALIRASPLLEHLGIGSCERLSIDALLQLGPLCPRMRNLNAHRLALSQADWELLLASLPALRGLDLSHSLVPLSPDFERRCADRFTEQKPFDW